MALPIKNMCSGDQSEVMENEKPVRNVDKNLLDIFWNLSKTKQPLRLHAAISIMRLLHEKQSSLDNKDIEKSPELEYAIERLVRGLSSSREAARQGFCLVLTEILRLFPAVTAEDVVQHIEKHLAFHNKMEKCHLVVGRVLAFASIVRSRRLKSDPYVSFVVSSLYELSIGKAYIQQGIYALIIDLYSQIDSEYFRDSIWPHLKKNLSFGWEKASPDTLWYLILSFRSFPDVISSKFLRKHWDDENLLSTENITHWQRVIKQSTTTHPQVHPVCLEFLNLSIQRNCLDEIWNLAIDEVLFEFDQNEKAYLGFMLVKEALIRTKKKKVIRSILSPKFCTALTKSCLNKKHPLNCIANDLLLFLSKFVNDCDDHHVQVAILKALLIQPRAILMEQILRKKEIIFMMTHFTRETVHVFYEILKNIILIKHEKDNIDEGEDKKPHIAVIQIGILVSHQAVATDISWKMNVLKFLFLHSFFEVKEPIEDLVEGQFATSHFSTSLRGSFKNSFTRCLDALNRKVEPSGSLVKQRLQFLTDIVDYADSLLQISHPSFSPLFSLEQVVGPWKSMKSIVRKLHKQNIKEDTKKDEIYAFQILFLHLGLQLFQDQTSVPDNLEELEICCRKSQLKKQMQCAEDDETPPWIQVVVDILLSLLSQTSHHMRLVVNSVFTLICPFMTADALQLIMDVINPEKEDDNPLMNEDSENDENDAEFESGSSDDDNDEDNNEKVDDEFKLKLQKILGTADDASDESEVVLSDSEMFKLDDTLAEVFRSRKKTGHTQLTLEQKSLMLFRIKCFDLISTYLKNEPPLFTVLQMIKPIISTYEAVRHQRHHEPLNIKTLSTLKQLAVLKTFQNYENVETKDFEELLDTIISKAHNETDVSVRKVLCDLCAFIVSCERKLKNSSDRSQKIKSEQLDTLDKYLSTLDDFVRKTNSHISPDMFTHLMDKCPEYASIFLKPLEKYAFDENIRLYRRSQCLGLLLSAIKYEKNSKQLSSEKFVKISKSLLTKAAEALTSVLAGSDIKPMYTAELLNLMVAASQILKDKEPSIIQSYINLSPLLTKMNATQRQKLGKMGKQSWRRLVILLGGELPRKRKQETPADLEESDANTDAVKKKKFKKDIVDKSPNSKIKSNRKMKNKKFKKAINKDNDISMKSADDDDNGNYENLLEEKMRSTDSESDD